MYSMLDDVVGTLKNVFALGLYFVIGFLGIAGILYLLTHLFSTMTAISVLDDQLRIVWETLRYRL